MHIITQTHNFFCNYFFERGEKRKEKEVVKNLYDFFCIVYELFCIIVSVITTQYKNIIMGLKAKVEERERRAGKDILVRKAPLALHWKIDKYMEKSGMQKRESVIALLEKATEDITL